MIQHVMNQYLNGLLTNQQVIGEIMKLAKEIQDDKQSGNDLGLTEEELAFYDALTRPEAIKDFYGNAELIALTKELTETLRKNKTIDWQKRDTARAKMRMMIKKLLKKYKYPPENMEDALETVMIQCELWTDNNDMGSRVAASAQTSGGVYTLCGGIEIPSMVAEEPAQYEHKHPND